MPKTTTVRTGSGLEITAEGLGKEYKGLLIPVPYNSGWSAKAGGKKLAVSDVNGLFMYVETDGEEKIVMSYFPTYMMTGIVISVIALLGFIALCVYDRKHEKRCGKTDAVLAKIYAAAFVAAALVIYVIPVLYAIKLMI